MMSPALMLKVCNHLRLARRHFAITKTRAPQGLESAFEAALSILYLLEESRGPSVDLGLLLHLLRRNVDESTNRVAARIDRCYRELDIHPDILAHEALRSAASTLVFIQGR
jgi:hypothetical protein